MAGGSFGGGSGSQSDPWMIEDVDDLQAMKDFPAAFFKLASNIDASATVDWNGGLGFVPIGQRRAGVIPIPPVFTGGLDGDNFIIRGLTINRVAEDRVGLFGNTIGCIVKNLVLEDFSISGRLFVGGLVGEAGLLGDNDCVFEDVVFSGSVRGVWASGVISSIEIGGLFGNVTSSAIRRCYVKAMVLGDVTTGGMAGRFRDCLVEDSKSECEVRPTEPSLLLFGSSLGVFAGASRNTRYSNCYAEGLVEGEKRIGGFTGFSRDDSVFLNCYASVSMIAEGAKIGGFCGESFESSSVFTGCFWDLDKSQVSSSEGGIGLNSVQMKSKNPFVSAGWSIASVEAFLDEVWFIAGGRDTPRLYWEYTPVDAGYSSVRDVISFMGLDPSLVDGEAIAEFIRMGDSQINLVTDRVWGPLSWDGELYDATGYPSLRLRNYPIIEVAEVELWTTSGWKILDRWNPDQRTGFWRIQNHGSGILEWVSRIPAKMLDSIRVSYISGYRETPEYIRSLSVRMASIMALQRESGQSNPSGFQSISEGALSLSWGSGAFDGRIKILIQEVEKMLEQIGGRTKYAWSK